MSAEEELTECERRLLEAAGALVDVREGDPRRDDPAHAEGWGAERTVRAEFLRDLLTNPARGIRALRLRGARITETLDLEGDDLACGVLLQDCGLDEPVNLRQARAPVIRLPGCHLPSLEAVQLDVRGNLILDRLTATSVDLRGAQIAGVLSLDGAILTNPNGATLTGGALTVGQGMSCGHGFTSKGEIGLYGARISQGLSFTGATLENAAGWALDAQGMHVGDYLFLGSSIGSPEGFNADGGLRLIGVRVDGFVCCWGAHIKPHREFGAAIAGWGLTVTGNLMMNKGFAAEGVVHLINAQVGEEIDLKGAILSNPQGHVLRAERLAVGDSMLCTKGFTARGAVSLADSKIGGSLDFTSALLRVVHKRRGQLYALLVAMRQRLDLAARTVRHLQALQPRPCGGRGVSGTHPVEPAQVLDLLGDEHARVEAPLLGHVAETASFGPPDRRPVPPNRAGVQVGQAEDGPHGGGLPSPVGPEKTHHLARRDTEAQPVECRHGTESTGQTVKFEETAH